MNTVQRNNQPVTPSKILCVGRNYLEHIHELNNEVPEQMVLFAKFNSSIGETLLAYQQEPIHYEGELCFMVENGRFAAVGFGLDLTKRGLQSRLKSKGLPWEQAKAFDSSVVFSEFVDIKDSEQPFQFELTINGNLTQQGDTRLMIHSPAQILEQVTSFATLEDGDIVMAGTPKGVGVVNAGDRFAAKVTLNEETLLEAQWVSQ